MASVIGELNRSGVQTRVINPMRQQGVQPITSSPSKPYQGFGVPSPFLPGPPPFMQPSPANPMQPSPANLMRSSPAGPMRTPSSYSPGYPPSHVESNTNESGDVAWEKAVFFVTSLNYSFNISNLTDDRRSLMYD